MDRVRYIESIRGETTETSFTSNDDGKTVTITRKGNRSTSAHEVEFVDTKVSRNYTENFKFNPHSDKVIELRLNVNRTGNNNITYKPLANNEK